MLIIFFFLLFRSVRGWDSLSILSNVTSSSMQEIYFFRRGDHSFLKRPDLLGHRILIC
ncbi:hypothetical protein VDG1235_2393 [Verrucomicrobiia bacterium DG1235]|nr:hypothetical protein VDG1235_2393 [Verrucomicrobiae bacterium DG1235]